MKRRKKTINFRSSSDDLGNRLSTTLWDGSTDTYSVDTTSNRYNSIDSANLDYDDAGNLTIDKDGYHYRYDYENRPVEIRKSNDTIPVARFAYDALGRRIKKEDMLDSTKTRYYYYSDNWQVLAEYNGSGTLQAWYAYGNYIDEVLLMHRNSADYYYLQDHLYSPAALLDTTGSVVERYEYDAYGKATIWNAALTTTYSISQYGNAYTFTGRELDTFDNGNLKKMHYRHREYSPFMGRFYQEDPLQYVDGMNLYEYVKSSPVMYTDFSGLFFSWDHSSLTQKAFKTAVFPILVTRECASKIIEKMQKANNSQDKGAAFDDFSRHYNRKPGEDEEGAKRAYDATRTKERIEGLTASINGDCAAELDSIARLDHTIEDFFAHAVGPNGETELWINGANWDPDNKGNTHPSSYPGEHPGLPKITEPGEIKGVRNLFREYLPFLASRAGVM